MNQGTPSAARSHQSQKELPLSERSPILVNPAFPRSPLDGMSCLPAQRQWQAYLPLFPEAPGSEAGEGGPRGTREAAGDRSRLVSA